MISKLRGKYKLVLGLYAKLKVHTDRACTDSATKQMMNHGKGL